MTKTNKVKIRLFLLFILLLMFTSVVFWLDDVTGIGEQLDALEFLFQGIIAIIGTKILWS